MITSRENKKLKKELKEIKKRFVAFMAGYESGYDACVRGVFSLEDCRDEFKSWLKKDA